MAKTWTEADKSDLVRFHNDGVTIQKQAEYFKVSKEAVHQMRYRLGLTQQQIRPNMLAALETTVKVTGKNKDTGFVAYRNLSYCVAGLGSEAGEVLDQYKKLIRNDESKLTSERRESILAEVGDVLWYCQAIIIALRGNIDDVIKNNQDKLFARMAAGEINERGRTGTAESAG